MCHARVVGRSYSPVPPSFLDKLQHGRYQEMGQEYEEEHEGYEEVDGEEDEEGYLHEREEDEPRYVDNPALDKVGPHVQDLYYAVARPRFDADPVCLRRQREGASAAAGEFIYVPFQEGLNENNRKKVNRRIWTLMEHVIH